MVNQAGKTNSAETKPAGVQSAGWQSKAVCILPLVCFFVLGALIDTQPMEAGQAINPQAYQWLVVLRVLAMSAVVLTFASALRRMFPLQMDHWGLVVVILGAVLWIGICHLQLERSLFGLLGAGDWLPDRDGVNPWQVYPDAGQRFWFLVSRFSLLAVCVPVAEELFLRGFVMRAVEFEAWDSTPLNRIGRTGLLVGTLYGVATHPAELFAAAVWFSLVTWLMVKTGKFWNCVLAHAVTNLLLGIYVCWFSQWHLW